jgi:hypothetical protein
MPKGVRVSINALRTAWQTDAQTSEEIAAQFGMSRRQLSNIARDHEFPPKKRKHARQRHSIDQIKPLWLAGVSCADIAAHLGTTRRSVNGMANRHGLPRRGANWKPILTLDEYLQDQLARAMSHVAARENDILARSLKPKREAA